MKKAIIILMTVFCLGTLGQAQTKSNSLDNTVSIGVKGGLNVPRMLYTDANLAVLPQDFTIKPIGGLYVDIPMGEFMMLSPEVMFVQRGMTTSYEHQSGSQVNYHIASQYVDLRLPLAFRLRVVDAFQPYAVAGLEAGYLLGGEIHLDRTAPIALDETIAIGSANMASLHGGVFAGLGIRSEIDFGSFGIALKLEASYHQGLIDSYSTMEHNETATPLNVNAYNIAGLRMPRGLEFCIGIGLPLKFNNQKDACWTFSRNKYN